MTPRRVIAVCLFAAAGSVALSVVAPPPAQAQTAEDKKKAREYYQKGTTAYDLGRFDEAIDYFTKAYELLPDPVFLYNIAQAHRMKGDLERAIFFYKRYLSKAPNAKNRDEVEKRIAELEAELKKQSDPKPDVKPPDPKPDVKPPDPKPDVKPPDPKPDVKPPDPKPDVTPDDGDGDVADARGDDDGDIDAAIGDGGVDGTDGAVSGATTVRKPIRVYVEAGAAMLNFGGADLTVPAQFAIDAGGAYLLSFGKLGVGLGAGFGFIPVPWVNDDWGAEGRASLTTLRATADARWAFGKKLEARAGLGLGVTWFGGLVEGNPFTQNSQAATGAVPMFNWRVSLGVDYRLGGGLILSATPVAFAGSPAPTRMVEGLDQVTRFEVLIGLGYAL